MRSPPDPERSVAPTQHEPTRAEHTALRHDLSRAVVRAELSLVYQPVLEAATGRVAAVEALARWNHPDRGLVGPDQFVSEAEAAGLIGPLGWEVLRLACADRTALPEQLPIAVNVSPVQLADPDFGTRFLRRLAALGARPEQISIEITETAAVAPSAIASLTRLRAAGVRVALDDFGTGYSSFAALHLLPLDALKIDRSFTSGLGAPTATAARAVVAAMVDVARAHDLTTTAEGVERSEHLAAVRSLGCTHIQGHLVAPPMPLDELVAFLAR